jgi:hypothetical protein
METKTYTLKDNFGFTIGCVNAETVEQRGMHTYFYIDGDYIASYPTNLVEEVKE